MDEEYDVIVLGTGLTVSAAPRARSPTSLHPPCSAAAPDTILSLSSAALPTPGWLSGPRKKKQPRAHPHDVASTHCRGSFSKNDPRFSAPSTSLAPTASPFSPPQPSLHPCSTLYSPGPPALYPPT